MRFLWVALIVFLALGPFIKLLKRTTEKPKLVFLLDRTKSMLSSGDSDQVKNLYQQIASNHLQSLNDFDVRLVNFGNSGTDAFNGNSTDISNALRNIKSKFGGTNVAGIVLASDGIYNQGMNPEYSKDFLNAPIYSVMTGDTSIPKDLSIATVINNDFVYQGND